MKPLSLFRNILVFMAALLLACSDNHDHADTSPPQKNETSSTPATKNAGVEAKSKTQAEVTPITRFADKHTHGDAELGIVLENGKVIIEFESPLYNILGFEHSPETDKQHITVARAEKQLSRGTELFIFNDEAGCGITSKNMAVKLFTGSEDNETHDDHDNNDQHSHENKHQGHEENTHQDVFLSYEFTCQNPSSLSSVNINLFQFFEDLSDIDVTYLGPSAQKQVNLTRKNTQMDLSR